MEFRYGCISGRLGKRAVGHADGLAKIAILALVAGVIAAETHAPLSHHTWIDFGIFWPVVAGQLQGCGEGSEIRVVPFASVWIDRYPSAFSGVGALSIVGVARAFTHAQSVDGASCQRGLAEIADRAAPPRCRRNELEISTACCPV